MFMVVMKQKVEWLKGMRTLLKPEYIEKHFNGWSKKFCINSPKSRFKLCPAGEPGSAAEGFCPEVGIHLHAS